MNPFGAWCLAVTMAVMLAGCANLPTTTTPYAGAPTFPPTTPAQVAILTTDPGRPYVRLGQVSASSENMGISKGQVEAALKGAAAKLGADAVVVIHDENNVVGSIMTGPWYNRQLDTIHSRDIVGVAIKYTGAPAPTN